MFSYDLINLIQNYMKIIIIIDLNIMKYMKYLKNKKFYFSKIIHDMNININIFKYNFKICNFSMIKIHNYI